MNDVREQVIASGTGTTCSHELSRRIAGERQRRFDFCVLWKVSWCLEDRRQLRVGSSRYGALLIALQRIR
jgi:hypothetical protein